MKLTKRFNCDVVNLDVWASPEGWDINSWNTCGIIEFDQYDDGTRNNDTYNDAEIIAALKRNCYLGSEANLDTIAIEDWFENSIIILKKDDGMPLYRLDINEIWEVPSPYSD